jgi:hypothetical protein
MCDAWILVVLALPQGLGEQGRVLDGQTEISGFVCVFPWARSLE